jgi:hypothetical protein
MVAWPLLKGATQPGKEAGELRGWPMQLVTSVHPQYPMMIIRKECIRRLQ